MCPIPGGHYRLGSERHYPDEAPVREIFVDPFEIDELPVTNDLFAAFVAATGYITVAERTPDARLYPGTKAGSIVFRLPRRGDLPDPGKWWHYVDGASWRAPSGPWSNLRGKGQHPVVHVALADAAAFAAWAGKSLPTEAQWEVAARGGLIDRDYAWGDELAPGGRLMANYWSRGFPWVGPSVPRPSTSPVGRYPANDFGIRDMIGNVWEWTVDDYALPGQNTRSCCGSAGRDGDLRRKVLKGGSHLCAPEYCRRYRPAARHPQDEDSGTSHIGFRCVSTSGA